MTEQAIYFPNPAGQHLFGMLQSGNSDATWGVVFCHPMEHEKFVTYRTIVNFARFLAKAGIPSLNFDCHGFGNSDGELIDSNVETQVADVRLAISKLAQEYKLTRVVLIGVRFGASIAHLVAQQDDRVSALVLTAPIVSGKKYCLNMLNTQRMSAMLRGKRSPKLKEILESLNQTGSIEINAELFSKDFIEQMDQIDLLSDNNSYQGPLLITASQNEKSSFADISQLLKHYQNTGTAYSSYVEQQVAFWVPKTRYSGESSEDLFTKTLAWLRELEL